MNFSQSRPESLGISPHTIARFLDRCEKEVHSLYSYAIVRGTTVASSGYYSPMRPDQLKMLHSVSKSVNAMAVGIAIGEGKLHLDDRLFDLFPEEFPKQHDARVERITVKNMLMMAASSAKTSAIFHDVSGSWKKFYLGLIPYAEPGTYFSYDTGAAYMLSCAVSKAMKKNCLSVIKDYVFSAIGIEESYWLEDCEHNNTGGWGLYLKAEDLLKLGYLVANHGCWEGRQLIPEQFMHEATKKQIDTYLNPGTGWPYGYGYQFWIYPHGLFGWYGAFGQLLVCDSKRDLWVVTTAGCSREENQRLLHIIIETIFDESQDTPIPPEEEIYCQLQDRISKLTLPVVGEDAASSCEKNFFGRNYRFPQNPAGINRLRFSRKDEETISIEMEIQDNVASFTAGSVNWNTFEDLPLDAQMPLHKIHSFSYGWRNPTTLVVKQYLCNTTYVKTYIFSFSDNLLEFSISQNISVNASMGEKATGVAE